MRRLGEQKSVRGGFTMLEATVALGLLLLGLLGMGALAAAAIRTNMEAQDRTQAVNLLNRVLEEIQVEALGWNDASWRPETESDNAARYLPAMRVLPLEATGDAGYREYSRQLTGGGVRAFAYDLRMVPTNDVAAKYCVHYNMTWLNPNESVRADVRVYWMRRGADPAVYGFRNNCGQGNVRTLATNVEDIRCAAGAIHLMRNARGDPT